MLIVSTRSRVRLFAVCALCWLAGMNGIAYAQAGKAKAPELPEPKIAIVNVEVALNESKAVKSARAQLNEISSRYKKEIDVEEASLRRGIQELQQQSTIMAPEALAQRRDEYRRQDAQLQQKARALRQAMDQGFRNTMQNVQTVLFAEVAKIAKEIDANLVLPSSQIILAVEGYDITRMAIERLDARLPDVTLKMEEKPAGAGSPDPSGKSR
jgi:Skp family chaperone for outer membrane proteins